jgi:hypothetical protein
MKSSALNVSLISIQVEDCGSITERCWSISDAFRLVAHLRAEHSCRLVMDMNDCYATPCERHSTTSWQWDLHCSHWTIVPDSSDSLF